MRLQLHDTRSQGLELRLGNRLAAPVVSGTVTFGELPAGQYSGMVHRHGQPMGSTVEFTVLPALEWTLTQRQAHQPILEGQWQAGRVTLQDGRFTTFRLKPEWVLGEKWSPRSHQIDVLVDEWVVPLRIEAQSYGARLLRLGTQEIVSGAEHPSDLRDVVVLPLYPQGSDGAHADWTTLLESQPHASGPLEKLTPAAFDRVVIEFNYRNVRWRAHAVPVTMTPRIISARVTP